MRTLGLTTEIRDFVERFPLESWSARLLSLMSAHRFSRRLPLCSGEIVLCGVILCEFVLDVVVDALELLRSLVSSYIAVWAE